MYEKIVCRFCESQSFHQGMGKAGSRKTFAIPGSSLHYAPDRPFKLEHIFLDLAVDPKGKTLRGTVIQRIRVVSPHQTILKLDQVGLQIEEVKIGTKSLDFRVEGEHLNIPIGITVGSEPQVGEEFELSVRYSLKNPRRGIYFTGPDSHYPHKPYQVWTQGQDEDSRYWFPTLDYPSQKATSEVAVTVPQGFTAISNGLLLSKKELQEGVRYHYKLGIPHVTYLISLVVAEFVEWSDTGARGLPVQYFVPVGREEDGKRAFSRTPQMIEAFEKKTGVPYPYEKYSQVAVQDFIFGGMENTSATTQTDLTLHDERAHLDFSSDPLVAHELAHQWFGDLLTCRDWSHGWLNEGFATFMERVWVESDTSSRGGFEEAKYYSYQDLKQYLSDDQNKYRRPIVCNNYIEPIDLFDSHLYKKGGLVLNFIRYVLGDGLFWKSIQVYLTRHRGQNVETIDLIRAIEDTTGRNLRRHFDEWVFNSGYPEFEVSYSWHEDKKMTEWVVEQKQTGGAPFVTQEGATTFLFHLPVALELTLADGQKITHRVDLSEARERVFLPAPTQPVMVRFDPNFWIPKTLKFPRPKEMLLFQLSKDLDCMGRIEAAQELVKIADFEVIEALGKSASTDLFWGVQAESAKALAEIRMDSARDQLILALHTPHPKARRAIASALGTFHDASAADALKKLAEKDESYWVEADATYAWLASKLKPAQPLQSIDTDSMEKFLFEQLNKTSYREVIRSAALSALADLPGIGRGSRPKALQVILDWTRRGHPQDVRNAAVKALGKILKHASSSEKGRIFDVLAELADEENFRLRSQLVSSLEESGCSEAISVLGKIRQIEVDGRVKRGAQAAIDVLLTAGTLPESLLALKASLEKLEDDHKRLRSIVDERAQVNSRL